MGNTYILDALHPFICSFTFQISYTSVILEQGGKTVEILKTIYSKTYVKRSLKNRQNKRS